MMTAKALFNINYLSFSSSGVIDFKPFIITNVNTERDKFFTKDILFHLGNNIKKYPAQSVYAHCEFEIDDNLELPEIQDILSRKLKEFSGLLFNYITFLWFVKDNSISLGMAIAHVPGVKKAIATLNSNSVFSKCTGKRERTIYTKNEILYAEVIHKKCVEVLSKSEAKPLPPDPIEWELTDDGKKIRATQGHSEKFDYSLYNVFQRAFVFLASARRLDYLVYRIASFMPLFECLFTTERNEVTQKVCERVAFYLGIEPQERVVMYNDMKWLYDLRSAYLHGQSPSKKQVDSKILTDKSIRLDELLRATLTMIIMVDSDIFGDDNKRDKYLRYLIFGERAYLFDPENVQKKEQKRKQAQKQQEKKTKTDAQNKNK